MIVLHYLPFLAALAMLGLVMLHRMKVEALTPVKSRADIQRR